MEFNLKKTIFLAIFLLNNSLAIFGTWFPNAGPLISKKQQLDEALAIALLDSDITEEERAKEVADLIKKGANANAVYPNNNLTIINENYWYEGVTPLILALGVRNFSGLQYVSYRLLRKVNESEQSIFNGTCSLIGSIDSNYNIIKMLIAAGADVNFKNKVGYPIIFFSQDPIALEILIDKGANIDAVNPKGETLLMSMVRKNEILYELFVKILLAGKDSDVVSFYRLSVEKTRQNIGVLLRKGANLDIKDNEGQTVFDYATNAPIIKTMLNNAKKMREKKQELNKVQADK